MIKMTDEEIKTHQNTIKKIVAKSQRARDKHVCGDMSSYSLRKIEREVRQEELKYIQNSGVILYYGTFFRSSK